MNIQQTYLDNLKRLRPNQYKALKSSGKLNTHAAEIEKQYREAKQRNQQNGMMPTEADELATQTWLEVTPESEEANEAKALRQSESREGEFQAEKLAAHLQGYDPAQKSRQEWQLGDGRKVVRHGNREIVYPAATTASTPPSSDKAEPNKNTATT